MTKFAKVAKPTKVKIKKSNSEKSWYNNRIGEEFIIDSESTRDYYVEFDGFIRCILKVDAIRLN